jgi:hypothetical protein
MTLPANTVTARMQTILGEAAPSTESKEKILQDYLEYVPKEVALVKKVQAQGSAAVAALRQAQRAVEGGFLKYAEGLKRKGSELDLVTDEISAIKQRAEKLSPDELGDLEDTILWASFSVEDAVYSDRLQKMQKALDAVIEMFEEYDASENEMASHLKALDRKVKAAKDLLRK